MKARNAFVLNILILFSPTFLSKPCNDSTIFNSRLQSPNEETMNEAPFKISSLFALNGRCDFYNPSQPHFKYPGKRTSVIKCCEYIREKRIRDNLYVGMRTEYKFEKRMYITKGEKVKPMEYPHMGAIGWASSEPDKQWKFMCGCSLISRKFALTAAHCSKADPRDTSIADVVPSIVRFGVEQLYTSVSSRPPVDRNIIKVIDHPKYASPSKYYDIALIELEKPVTFNDAVQPACLWTDKIDQIEKVNATGWGVKDPHSRDGSADLLKGALDIIDTDICSILMEPYYNRQWPQLEDHQMCAGQLQTGVGVDTCQGDSGGPIQVFVPEEDGISYIVGVTSFGVKCAQEYVPGIYTKVSYFLDWIEENVWGRDE